MHSTSQSTKNANKLTVCVAIPARWASSRLPGKPLAIIGGQTMIRRVYQRASKAAGISEVLVATDDDRIAKEVKSFGGKVVMTRPDHPSGTDRLAEVFASRDVDVVVNVQGDEPFLDSEIIEALIAPFKTESDLEYATLKTPITDKEDLLDTTIAKLVTDKKDNVLYFSRSPIPFVRERMEIKGDRLTLSDLTNLPIYKHVGIYAYRREFLLQFAKWGKAPIEDWEKLEQLRALYHGVRVRAVTVSHSGFSVDTEEDLLKANAIIGRKPKEKEPLESE